SRAGSACPRRVRARAPRRPTGTSPRGCPRAGAGTATSRARAGSCPGMITAVRRYENFAVGDVYHSAVGRTVTETDNLLFTMLAMNTNELHFNEEAARASEWGRPLVNSTFTVALVLGLSVPDTTQAGGVNLGWREIRLPKPVFVGDTIRTETEVLEARESSS